LSRLATSFVLGYHGCDKSIAEKAVLDGSDILQSDRAYDWLGPGAYFWESDPKRALEWAQWKVTIGAYKEACVIGAVIDLRNCLDLSNRDDVELVRAAHKSFTDLQAKAGLEIPKNKNVKGSKDNDRVLRFLDCAVIKHLHEIVEETAKLDDDLKPFDTVRGMFAEGGRAFSGSGIYRKSHVQIAVRNMECIKGIFFPRGAAL